MRSAQSGFVAFLIGAAVGAGAMLFVPSAGEQALRDRVSDLETDLTEARREAGDWQRVALAERERKEAAEAEAARLRQVIATAPARPAEAGGGMGEGGMGGHSQATDDDLAPEDWDDPRLRMEIQRLSMAGRRMPSSPRLDACVRAARAQGDSALGLLIDIMRTPGMSADIRRAATLILEKLGDQRAVGTLLKAWDESEDPAEKRLLLRALANLPGSEQLPLFAGVWADTTQDAGLRMIAIHALAARGQPTALRAIRGDASGVSPAQRARAIESLHSHVRDGDYEDTSFIPTFGKALVSADGEGQQRLTLLALEGYWHPDCVPHLRAFAALDGVLPELRDRALGWADSIEKGEPRPERAGLPKAQTVDPDDVGGDGE